MSKRPPVLRTWLDDAIIVDNFAGGGGASSGVARALGRSPDIAINHDPEAIAMHAANHPDTRHYIESVWNVDPVEACGGKRVALAWFSPTCTHFSKAKGTALDAESVKIRGLAWVAVRWAAAVAPAVICLENVEEFEKWGPLNRDHTDACRGVACADGCRFGQVPKGRRTGRDGKFRTISRHDDGCPGVACAKACRIHKPIKSREGETFRAFVGKLSRLGYAVEWRQLRACDYGAPTTRKRLFMVARRDGLPIVWPAATHGPKLARQHRAASECIDWSVPCPSIFERDRPLADKTLARIARGIRKFVLENPRPFIVPVAYGGVDGRVNDIDEPMPTICGNRGGHALVTPYLMPNNTNNVPKGVDEPVPTITTGNRNFLITPALFRVDHGDVDASGKKRGQGHAGLEDPLPTLCAGGGQFAIATPIMMKAKTYGGGGNDATSAEKPLGTVTASKRGEFAIAVPYLVHRSNGERAEKIAEDGRVIAGQEPRVYDITKPLGTIVAQGQKHAACVALLIKHNGGNNDLHGSSGQAVDKPMDTLATHNTKALTLAHLVKFQQNSIGTSPDDPMHTVMAGATRHGLVASHLVKLRGTSDAHIAASACSLEDPMPTISAGGGKGGIHVAQVAAFLMRYNGQSTGQVPNAPIGTLDTTDRYGLITVMIAGEEYVVVDIGMRMLTPRELYRAQGFDDGYKIDPVHNGKKLTKTAQIRMVGNSVPPVMAEVIARAQLEAA